MKHVKKLFSAVLVLVMALAMALPVAAAEGEDGGTTDNYSITIKNDKTGHTYEAYQIFTGDLAADGTLSNIVWGSGVTEAGRIAMGDASDKAAGLTEANVKEFAEKLATGGVDGVSYLQSPTSTSTQNDGKYVIGDLAAGYYLVKDANGSLAGATDDAYTAYILKVVTDVIATPKSSVPSVDKQVQDETGDAETGAADGWGETADHAINESFQFKLTATLPKDIDIANYDKYKVVFNDTMSSGITFEGIAENGVKVNGVVVNNYTPTAIKDQKGGNWSLTIDDIKVVLGSDYNYNQDIKVEVVYNAHLNENAVVNTTSGGTTNKNTVNLQYSNNPNVGGGNDLGKTPDDHVWVFTYEVDNNKVDENENPLAGAGFKLYAANVAEDGTATITDTVIPVVPTGNPGEYRLAKDAETGVEMKTETVNGTVQNLFNIKGLDTGKYFLKETTTPDGYNTCEPKLIIIDASHNEIKEGSDATTTLTSESLQTMNNMIQNNKGSVLPGTGGIGRTIFYVGGGILVVGAAVLLIAKKRTRM